MNVLRQYTRASLGKNRTRTLVTIIGIVLSMALVTAVLEGAWSGQQFLIRSEAANSGAYHGIFSDLDAAQKQTLSSTREFASSTELDLVGWAGIETSVEYMPYLVIYSANDNLTDLASVHLISGRIPENDSELLLPGNLIDFGTRSYALGDTLELEVGRRVSDGVDLGLEVPLLRGGSTLDGTEAQEPSEATEPAEDEITEELIEMRMHSYTVVGFYERLDYNIDPYSSPGFLALTKGAPVSDQNLVLFTLRNPMHYYTYMPQNPVSNNYVDHRDLLEFSGSLRNSNFMEMLYGFAGVLIALIAVGSVTLIYNSFSISVSERTRQFGILKSVGATGKQLRGTVLYEAALLCGVSIPAGLLLGCAGIGVVLWFFRDSFRSLIRNGAQLKLVLNPVILAIAAAVGLLTTLIAAWIPARRALRIQPINAIRQSSDVKLGKKDVRSGKLSKLLFGFPGQLAAKNFHRDRKRYRAAVVSLFLSVTLFIGAPSFCAYLTDATTGIATATGRLGNDISYTLDDYEGSVDENKLLADLSALDSVQQVSYFRETSFGVKAPNRSLTTDFLQSEHYDRFPGNPQSEETTIGGILFLDDEAFRRLCKANGLDPEDYFDLSAPRAVYQNQIYAMIREGDQYYYDVIDAFDDAPEKLSAIHNREIPGYQLYEEEEDENGVNHYYYYTKEYIEQNGEYGLDRKNAIELTGEEALERTPIMLGEELRTNAWKQSQELEICFPISQAVSVFGSEVSIPRFFSYSIQAEDHAAAMEEISDLLQARGLSTDRLADEAEHGRTARTIVTAVNVFAYSFILLISLVAMANVFNTISTSVLLRRREFAMLMSVGMGRRSFRRMMNYECLLYGLKALLWGLPASVLLTWAIFRIMDIGYRRSFFLPWYSVAIAVVSVFLVVFATMLYATNKLKKGNPIDALKNENL